MRIAMDTHSKETKAAHASRHARELNALYQISQLLAEGTTGQRQTLEEVLDVLEKELGMIRGTILLLLPSQKELRIEAGSNLSEARRRAVRYRRGEGIFGRVVETGEPAIIPEI